MFCLCSLCFYWHLQSTKMSWIISAYLNFVRTPTHPWIHVASEMSQRSSCCHTELNAAQICPIFIYLKPRRSNRSTWRTRENGVSNSCCCHVIPSWCRNVIFTLSASTTHNLRFPSPCSFHIIVETPPQQRVHHPSSSMCVYSVTCGARGSARPLYDYLHTCVCVCVQCAPPRLFGESHFAVSIHLIRR